MTDVSDNLAFLANLKDSKYNYIFKEEIDSFDSRLGGIEEYLMKLNSIQRKWIYLEPIFGRGALPQQQAMFKNLDNEYRNIMQELFQERTVCSLCGITGVEDTLEQILSQLERC